MTRERDRGELPTFDTIATLDPERSPLLRQKLGSARVVVADVDYTLLNVDPGHWQGIQNLGVHFDSQFATHVDALFQLIIEGHRKRPDEPWDKRQLFDDVMARIRTHQQQIPEEYSLKYWSVETWMKVVAEMQGKELLTKEQIIHGRDAYWQGRKEASVVYDDVTSFTTYLQQHGMPIYLMTSSYHILDVNDDASLSYNPQTSEAYKRKRLTEGLPFSFDGTIIGDPIDKPDPRFFDKVFETIPQPPRDILVIGDSGRNDLMVPQQRGYQTLLLKR